MLLKKRFVADQIQTNICHVISVSTKITTYLDHVSDYIALSGTHETNKWTRPAARQGPHAPQKAVRISSLSIIRGTKRGTKHKDPIVSLHSEEPSAVYGARF